MSRGCSQCYIAYYGEETFASRILSCAGPVLFVGAQKFWWQSTFYLGAFNTASEVHKITALNTPHASNGAYWYFSPDKSFGFLGNDTLHQATADTGTTNPESRLSWNLGNGHGGYRAGDNIDLSTSIQWRKIIYNCPNYIQG